LPGNFDGGLTVSDDKDAKRYKIICYLATGCTNKEAAQKAGVSLSTIERLKREAGFKQELSRAVNQVYRNGLTQLAMGIDKAVSELLRIIDSPDTQDRVKLKAIEILLTQAAHANNLALEQRISSLENRISLRNALSIDIGVDDLEDLSASFGKNP
jgi:hypothetical protein